MFVRVAAVAMELAVFYWVMYYVYLFFNLSCLEIKMIRSRYVSLPQKKQKQNKFNATGQNRGQNTHTGCNNGLNNRRIRQKSRERHFLEHACQLNI